MRRSFSASRPRLSSNGRRSIAAAGKPSLRSFSKVASEASFLAHGPHGGHAAGSTGAEYLTHDDINRRAIQILHHEGSPSLLDQPNKCSPQTLTRIIHPYDRFRRIFDLATVIWVLLLVFFLPLEIGFDWYNVPSDQKIFFSCLDFWFAIDIVLNFRTGYCSFGTVVMDPKKIASNYMSTWFVIDLLGTLPFEMLISGASSRKSIKLVKYFKIPKLLRVSRVMKFLRNHRYVYDFTRVILVLLTALHLGACIWVALINPCDVSRDGYAGRDVCAQANVYNVYAEALHLSATMILGVSNLHILGKPQLVSLSLEGREEGGTAVYIVSTLYMTIGLFLIALLISEANSYLLGVKQGSAAFQLKSDRISHELEYYAVPQDLQRQVKAYFDYVWINQKQYDDKIALLSDHQMSTDLQRKLALHLFKDVVSKCPFFSEIDDLLLGEICLSLRTRIFLPGDMILYKGDVGKELFIVSKGVVEVIRDDLPASKRRKASKILLRNGSFFGEIALVMEVRRTCSVMARTVCEVNILQQNAFDEILQSNPLFARRMNELVVARQLDSHIARTHTKGIDFQVSQNDIDLAVEVMEKNMKQGLERRRKKEPDVGSPPRSCLRGESKVYSPLNVSFEASSAAATVQGAFPPGREDPRRTDEESQLESSRLSNALSGSMSDVLQDIARRSTRFTNDNGSTIAYLKRMRELASLDRQALSLNEQSNDNDVTPHPSIDVCSDGEIEASRNDRENMNRRRASNANLASRKSKGHTPSPSATIAAPSPSTEEEDLTGHFTPGRRVDLAKVRPVLLNQERHHSESETLSALSSKLTAQDLIIDQLLTKIKHFEREGRKTKEDRNPSKAYESH